MIYSALMQVRHWTALALVLLMAALAYSPALRGDFVPFDDGAFVYLNRHVNSGLTWDNARWAFTEWRLSANWNPLTWLSHMTVVSIFGMDPLWHHAVNLALHLVNAALLSYWMAEIIGKPWIGLMTAALFALHPLHVESVAWIAERKDVLSTMFWFLAAMAYVRYLRKPGRMRSLLTAAAFGLGLMTKAMVITLPFVLLLLDYWPLGRFRSRERSAMKTAASLLYEKTPLMLGSAAMVAATYATQVTGWASLALENLPWRVKLANALTSFSSYLIKMLWPARLAVFYPHPQAMPPTMKLFAAAALAAVITAAAVSRRRRSPCLLVGWAWYGLTLLPVIGLIQVGRQAMADRYVYIPLVGIYLAAAWYFHSLAGRFPAGFSAAALAAILLTLPILTWRQAGTWRDGETLFRHALRVTENNVVAHENLANILLVKNRPDEAQRHFAEVIRLDPANLEAYIGLGMAYAGMGRFDKEIEAYRKALAVDPFFLKAANNLAEAYLSLGMTGEAEEARSLIRRMTPR